MVGPRTLVLIVCAVCCMNTAASAQASASSSSPESLDQATTWFTKLRDAATDAPRREACDRALARLKRAPAPARARDDSAGYILYVGFAQPDEWDAAAKSYAAHQERFERVSGEPCLLIPFSLVTPKLMDALAPRAVLLSGFARSFEQYDPKTFRGVADWLSTTSTPNLNLCGSHQLLGFVFNGKLKDDQPLRDEPMRKRRPGEKVINPNYHPEFFMELGYFDVKLLEKDPLFAGLGETAKLYESHYCEIKSLPPSFRLLASTPECRIQAIRHESRPTYGVQFHPEEHSDENPDGRRILENFFRIAGIRKDAEGAWTTATLPSSGGEESPAWYRCFVRVPDNMTSRSDVDLFSDSVTLSVAGIRGKFAVYLNGDKITEGDGLPDEPRKRVKVPKGILEKGKFNVLAIRLDAKAAAAGVRRAPILASYFDELVLEGAWEQFAGEKVDPSSLKAVEKQPAVAAYTEAGFRKSSTPLAASTELMPGRRISPAESLATMTTPDDLLVELIAHEPAVAQPTHISFDERGRMWVAQYRQYPYPAGVKMISRDMYYRGRFNKVPPPPPKHDRGADVISVHEDTDHDGTFDKHKVVLDGLNMANAALRGHGGIWVMHSPYLVFYPDANGDDVPDRDPEIRLAGFGLEDTHSTANGLIWGPDGWLYGVTGSGITSRIVRPGVDPPSAPGVYFEGCMVWRYHPHAKTFEIFAEGGGNSFGLDFDSEGRLFSGDNGDATRGWHFVQSGVYAKGTTPVPAKYGPPRNPFSFGILTKMTTSNPIPRFTHATVVFEGTGLPSRYAGQIIGANPLQRKLVSAARNTVGSTMSTTDTGFPLAASDVAFRPVCLTTGADGALYVGDFYEEFIAHGQHYQSQIDPTSGRIYRLRGKQQQPQRDVNLAGKTTAQLVEILAHANRWHRHTAVRLLGERRDASAVEPLKTLLGQSQTHPALEALWALHQMNALDEAATRRALVHPAAPVRAWATRLAGDAGQLTPEVFADVAKQVATETDAQVRSQVASTARRLPPGQALPLVAALLQRDADHADLFIPLLCWWTIESHCDGARDAVLALLNNPEFWQSRTTRETILPRLMRRFATKTTRADLLACAGLLRAAPSGEHRKALMSGFEEAFKGRALPPLPQELASALASSGHASPALRIRLGDADAIRDGLRVLADEKAAAADRLTMITLFGEVKVAEAVEPLLVLARKAPEQELSKAALTSLTLYDDDAIGSKVAGFYAELSAPVRPAAMSLLASRSAWSGSMLALVKAGTIKRADVPPDIVARLKSDSDARISAAASELFPAPPPTGPEARRAEIKRIRRVIDAAPGDPYAGEPIYLQRCASCHTLFFKGGQVGPNLSSYQREDLGTMLPSILDPSSEVREGFESYMLRTKDGRVLSGFLVENDAAIVVIRGTDGQDVRVPRDRVDKLKPTGGSLMPEGLLDGLSDQQVRDFFAYLRISQPITQ